MKVMKLSEINEFKPGTMKRFILVNVGFLYNGQIKCNFIVQ